MNEELLKAVRSLISDIESMQDDEEPNWFNNFGEHVYRDEDDTMSIEWPNLAISVAEVKKLLEPLTIEGELTKSQITKQAAIAKGIRVLDVKFEDATPEDLMGFPKS